MRREREDLAYQFKDGSSTPPNIVVRLYWDGNDRLGLGVLTVLLYSQDAYAILDGRPQR